MSLEHPNWNTDYRLYEYLFYKNKGGEPLTEQEEEIIERYINGSNRNRRNKQTKTRK